MGIRQGSEKYKQTQGDVMIWVIWDQQAESIIDVKLGDANADSFKCDTMMELLAWW